VFTPSVESVYERSAVAQSFTQQKSSYLKNDRTGQEHYLSKKRDIVTNSINPGVGVTNGHIDIDPNKMFPTGTFVKASVPVAKWVGRQTSTAKPELID
jgi:hypothetical protein